ERREQARGIAGLASAPGHPLLDRELRDVLRDRIFELQGAARRKREAERGLRTGIALRAGRRAAPATALRIEARDRARPLVTDRVARLEVVRARLLRALP